MKRLYWLVAIALLGVVIAVIAVVQTNRPPTLPPPAIAAAVAPFASFVPGAGITEIGRGNIVVATSIAGVVRQVYVKVGDEVAAGAPLFEIDDRDLRARMAVEQARVGQAEAALEKPKHSLAYIARLNRLDPDVVSAQSLSALRDDVAAAAAQVDAAQAVVAQSAVDIQRSVVHAPSAGRILQVGIRAGEFAATGASAAPLVLMGDDSRMYVRVDIDENDAARIRPEARAQAFARGNRALHTPLRFEYIEPYVTAKTSLTGQSTERSDVRVLQVVYSFARGALPVYVGQQMDVFIEAPAAAKPAARTRH